MSRRLLIAVCTMVVFVATASPALAAAGTLDPTFGSSGVTTTDLGGQESVGGMAFASGSRPLVVGTDATVWFVARYHADGTLDDTFHGTGSTSIDFSLSGLARAIHVDSLGRIVVAGFVNDASQGQEFAVARFLADGTPDTAFSGDGKEEVHISSAADQAYAVTTDSSNRIILAGYTTTSTGGTRFALARLTNDGSPDTSFSGTGIVTTAVSTNDLADAVTLDAKGRIVVAGWGKDGQKWAVARYRGGGALDTAFSGDGIRIIGMGNAQQVATAVAIDSKGRIDLGGYGESGSITNNCAAVRLLSNGDFDTGFSGDGKVVIASTLAVHCDALAATSNDRLVLVGDEPPGAGSSHDVYVARLTATGKRDATFGSNGVATFAHSSVIDSGKGVGIQSSAQNGRIVVAGDTQDGSPTFEDILLLGVRSS